MGIGVTIRKKTLVVPKKVKEKRITGRLELRLQGGIPIQLRTARVGVLRDHGRERVP